MPPLRDIPRWFLLVILVYAPWVFGSTRPWAKEILTWLLLALSGLFFLVLLGERRRPQIPRFPAILVLVLFGLGWLMVLNPRATFDPVGPKFHEINGWISELPGTMDKNWSFPKMLLISGLLGAFVVACDMSGNASWRDRLWLTLALVGVSIILFGVVQRAAGARTIFWQWGVDTGKTFFATYRYHANAGAFINLVFPFIVTRAILTFRRPTPPGVRAFWCIASFVAVAAAMVNVSRAAMAVTGVLFLALVAWQILDWRRKKSLSKSWEFWASLGAVLLAIVVLASTFGVDRSSKRWMNDPAEQLLENSRYQVYDIIWKYTLRDSGWRGFGPGTFEITFPLSIKEAKNRQVGRWLWRYSHQDYLQTLVEWGWVGSVLWAVFLGGGLFFGLVRLVIGYESFALENRLLLGAACLALVGVYLHAMVDFPLQIASLQLYAAMATSVVWTCGSWTLRRKRRVKGREVGEIADTAGGSV